MREYDYPNRNVERLRRQSLAGSTGRRTRREKMVRMRYSDFKKYLKIYTATIAVAAVLIVGGGGHAVQSIRESMMVSDMITSFLVDCIAKETHRTDDNQHYFYDYDDIADYIEASGDFDVGLYLFNRNTDDYQTGRVLECTEYGSMDEYLSRHGWEDSDQWRSDIRQRIVTQAEIDARQAELDEMAEEHHLTTPDNTLGGAR